MNLKACAYARYSTDNQSENSIAYQMEKITEYCKQNNIALCAFYSDEAMSGTNLDRPGFNNMLLSAKRGEFNAVVIYDISRGSRDVGDWFTFRKEMMLLDIINGQYMINATNPVTELEQELNRLRIRKSELEDILHVVNRENKTVNVDSVINLFKISIASWNNENISNIIKHHITKIYADTDGNFTVNVGMHIIVMPSQKG